jgi:hypothetical protein
LVIATIIPITTKTTIATCIQIQVGDIRERAYRPMRADRPTSASRFAIYGVAMADRLRRPALAGLVFVCILAWLPSTGGAAASFAPVRAATSGLRGGLNVAGLAYGTSPSQADHDITWARRLNAKIVRIEIPWAVMEPTAAGQIDPRALAFTDRLMSDAGAAHIGVIAMVESTPCWASSARARVLHGCSLRHSGPANSWPPVHAGDYADFVAYLGERYRADLAAIEVWNEPDQVNEHYFAGPEKPKRYAAILRAAYPAIKHVAPNVPVLGASLVGSNGLFLRALYAAGIKGYYDGLAVHFYNLPLASLRSIHEVQLANGDHTPLWLNEFGWSSCWPHQKIQEEQGCVTKQVQGANLADTIHSLARFPYVAAAAVYKLQSSTAEDFGLVNANNTRKPAFAALAAALASPSGGSIGSITVHLRRSGAWVLASGSAPPGDFVRLEAFEGSVLRYQLFFHVDRFDRYSLKLPAVLGTSGLKVRVYPWWLGPVRAAQSSI